MGYHYAFIAAWPESRGSSVSLMSRSFRSSTRARELFFGSGCLAFLPHSTAKRAFSFHLGLRDIVMAEEFGTPELRVKLKAHHRAAIAHWDAYWAWLTSPPTFSFLGNRVEVRRASAEPPLLRLSRKSVGVCFVVLEPGRGHVAGIVGLLLRMAGVNFTVV